MTARPSEAVGSLAVVALLKETADSVGALVADHLELARVEIETDLRIYAGAVGTSLVAGVLLLVGYVFAWAAVAVALAKLWGGPAGFGAVAAAHLVLAGLGLGAVSQKLQKTKVLRESILEVRRSVRTLAHPVRGEAS